MNKPFKTHVHKGETSVPSVLQRSMNVVTLKTLWSRFSECVVNVSDRFVNVLLTFLSVSSTFSERFVNVFKTFLTVTVFSTFSERFVNVSDRFVNVFRTFCERFWPFCQRFQNVLSTFYKHFWTSRKRFTFCKPLVKSSLTFCKRSHGAYFMRR
jgi:hypothetical protein